MRRAPRIIAVSAAALAAAVAASVPAAASTPPAGPAVDANAVLDAKVGWSRFVAANFATPTSIASACPLLPPEEATAAVAAAGLVASVLPAGVWLYRDGTGAGITGVGCGNDLAKGNDPSDSTSVVVEATVLDGQAELPQYVTRLAGNNTPIVQNATLGGQTVNRCRSDPFVCVAAWHRDGLIVTVRLDGPRTDQSEAQALALLTALVPSVVANLAAVEAR